jgi:nucleoside-diphosphate-sugar epimerase
VDNTDLFDAAVLWPTNVYGRSSSHYGRWFEVASEVKKTDGQLQLTIDPKAIVHALHVDDCDEAYVSLAEHPDRSQISGEAFDISAHAYEMAAGVWKALEKEYGIEGQVEFVQPQDAAQLTPPSMALIFGYSQWVSSEKIRKLTGWTDKRMLFSENLAVYRKAYDSAAAAKASDVDRAKTLKQFLTNTT